MALRREVIKAIGVGAAALPTIGDATALAQETVASLTDAATAAFLAQFAAAWRPLDPQLRFVLRLIYARLQGLPPPAQLSPAELRRINTSLSFYFNAGGPPLPHIEETTINVPSGRTKLRLYDPGTTAPAPTVVLIHGGGWVFGSLDTYDGFARQIAKRSGLRCLSIEYALAPEHPFPAPLNDCIAAVKWAATEGSVFSIDPQRIAIIGEAAASAERCGGSITRRPRPGRRGSR
jgi:acetyl esterase/lipase